MRYKPLKTTAGLVTEFSQRISQSIQKAVIGKPDVVQVAIAVLLAESHALLEDTPGVAKTVLVKALALSLGLEFRRIQCTPDLLPSDVTGSAIFNQKTSDFEFRPGPIFANLLLVDELNRATPRTQSALLESMAERQVTSEGKARPLEPPFCVFATQNPFEYEGTFLLPEAQLDRFAVRLSIGYPSESTELQLLELTRERHPLATITPVAQLDELLSMQAAVRQIFVHEAVRRYIIQLVRSTRKHPDILIGASPRAGMALFHLSQALSAVRGHEHVVPETARYLAPFVLEHRLTLRPEARMRGRRAGHIVQELIERVPAPAPHKT